MWMSRASFDVIHLMSCPDSPTSIALQEQRTNPRLPETITLVVGFAPFVPDPGPRLTLIPAVFALLGFALEERPQTPPLSATLLFPETRYDEQQRHED